MNVSLQKSSSIQTRTDRPKFRDKRGAAVIGQADAFLPLLTVREHLSFHASLRLHHLAADARHKKARTTEALAKKKKDELESANIAKP